MTSSRHPLWADVAVFEDMNAGRALERYLTDHGLHAQTYFDKWARILLFLRPPRKTYRVQVQSEEVHMATDLLRTASPEVTNQALHCPSCGSLSVSYPQMTRKFILPTFLLHASILLHIVEHECYCEHCHFVWHLPARKTVNVSKAAAAPV